MPELPEVETTVRGLRPVLEGARITGLRLHREGLRRPFPADLGQRLTGATIAGLFILSNYCVIYTDRGDRATHDRLIVEAPTRTGLIVLRALSPEPGAMAAARASLASARCNIAT